MLWSLWAMCPPRDSRVSLFPPSLMELILMTVLFFIWERGQEKESSHTRKLNCRCEDRGEIVCLRGQTFANCARLQYELLLSSVLRQRALSTLKGRKDWQGCLAPRVGGRAQLIIGAAFLTLVLESCTLGEQILFTLMSHKLPLYGPVRLSLCELSSLCLPIGRHASVLRQPWLTRGSADKTPHLGIGLQRSVWWPYCDLRHRERGMGLRMPNYYHFHHFKSYVSNMNVDRGQLQDPHDQLSLAFPTASLAPAWFISHHPLFTARSPPLSLSDFP